MSHHKKILLLSIHLFPRCPAPCRTWPPTVPVTLHFTFCAHLSPFIGRDKAGWSRLFLSSHCYCIVLTVARIHTHTQRGPYVWKHMSVSRGKSLCQLSIRVQNFLVGAVSILSSFSTLSSQPPSLRLSTSFQPPLVASVAWMSQALQVAGKRSLSVQSELSRSDGSHGHKETFTFFKKFVHMLYWELYLNIQLNFKIQKQSITWMNHFCGQ